MCTIINPYNPAMPEKPNPSPLARKKTGIAVRPRPQEDTIIEQLFKPNDPDKVEAMNAATRERRAAKLDSRPQKTMLVIGKEFSPNDDRATRRAHIMAIIDRAKRGELTHEEATYHILELDAVPARRNIVQIFADTEHRLTEAHNLYMMEVNHATAG